jgi:signal transduction histidine kinase
MTRVWAEAEAVRQVFINLLTNAVQAIGDDGEITIRLRSVRAEHDGPAVEAVISDTGPGIAEHDLERIWTPFFSTKAKGTGLGLSIVRKTIEAHGGQVWAEACPPAGTVRSRGGRGARTGAAFHVRLPAAARGRDARPPSGVTASRLTGEARPEPVERGVRAPS